MASMATMKSTTRPPMLRSTSSSIDLRAAAHTKSQKLEPALAMSPKDTASRLPKTVLAGLHHDARAWDPRPACLSRRLIELCCKFLLLRHLHLGLEAAIWLLWLDSRVTVAHPSSLSTLLEATEASLSRDEALPASPRGFIALTSGHTLTGPVETGLKAPQDFACWPARARAWVPLVVKLKIGSFYAIRFHVAKAAGPRPDLCMQGSRSST